MITHALDRPMAAPPTEDARLLADDLAALLVDTVSATLLSVARGQDVTQDAVRVLVLAATDLLDLSGLLVGPDHARILAGAVALLDVLPGGAGLPIDLWPIQQDEVHQQAA